MVFRSVVFSSPLSVALPFICPLSTILLSGLPEFGVSKLLLKVYKCAEVYATYGQFLLPLEAVFLCWHDNVRAKSINKEPNNGSNDKDKDKDLACGIG